MTHTRHSRGQPGGNWSAKLFNSVLAGHGSRGIQTEKSRSIVVQDVALLIGGQKWSGIDVLYRDFDGFGPHHLI